MASSGIINDKKKNLNQGKRVNTYQGNKMDPTNATTVSFQDSRIYICFIFMAITWDAREKKGFKRITQHIRSMYDGSKFKLF